MGKASATQVAEKAVTLAYKHALWYRVKPNIVMVAKRLKWWERDLVRNEVREDVVGSTGLRCEIGRAHV